MAHFVDILAPQRVYLCAERVVRGFYTILIHVVRGKSLMLWHK